MSIRTQRSPCVMHACMLPNITKTHIKTTGKDSRWLLKRQERKTERKRRDTLPAIKDAEERRQEEKEREVEVERERRAKKGKKRGKKKGEFAFNQPGSKI